MELWLGLTLASELLFFYMSLYQLSPVYFANLAHPIVRICMLCWAFLAVWEIGFEFPNDCYQLAGKMLLLNFLLRFPRALF